MDVKAGDKVKFLNEQGGGVVIRIIDSRQALIQIEDGFEIPVLFSNLVRTEATGERNVASNTSTKNESKQVAPPTKPAITTSAPAKSQPLKVKESLRPLFAFVPLTQKLETETARFELFLLNDGDYYFYYTMAIERFDKLTLHEKGELEPEMKLSLGVFAHHELLRMNAIILDFLLYKEGEYKARMPIHFCLDLKSMNLLRITNFRENEFFYENAYIIDCSGETETAISDLKKILESKETKEAKSSPKAKVNNPDLEEIDLHIEEILENTQGMASGEILDAQMARFTTTLEGAIKAKTRRIVFIHGVGNGKLKYELRKALDTKYPDLQYQDASFAEYGFGATMVLTGK